MTGNNPVDPMLAAEPRDHTRGTPSSVLLVTPRWVRDGGVGAHVQASASLLAREGLQVDVVAAHVEPGEPTEGLTVHESPELFNAGAPPDRRLGGVLALQSTVVHIHQVDDLEILDFVRLTAPVVITVHAYSACTSGVHYFNPGQECDRAHGPGCVPNLLFRDCAHIGGRKTLAKLPATYRHISRRLEALRRADLVLSGSSAVDRHLAVNGIARRAVVPYFPTMTPKSGAGHETRRRVVFAGRIVMPKGIDVLIRAARHVDAEFVICGEGRRLDDMRRLAEQLGIAEQVCFRGWLDPDTLADEFANASVVVMPSVWPEPFGLVGIEAMAAGRPVVASATGGVVDWLEDGVAGLRVPPGDELELARALNELLADPGRQAAMGMAGRRVVADRFSPKRHVAALLGGYRAARAHWQSDALTTADVA